MKNFLITGGAGYIGSHVAHMLIDEGHKVTIIDSLITGSEKIVPKKAKLIKCDISNEKLITKVIQNDKFDLVMHRAGLIRADESVNEPEKYNEFSFEKAKIFLNTCFENGLKKVIFSSTASVYGNPIKNNVSENDELNPLNPYAETKLKFENFLINKSKSDDISYIILRYFNVAGADEKLRSGLISKHSTHLIKIASEVAIGKRDEIIINGDNYDTNDGTAIRDYIHVSDLADIHLVSAKYLLDQNQSNIFNCGYGYGYSVKEVIDTYNKILNKKIKFKIGPRRPGDSKMVVADPSKFNKTLNWQPKFNNLEYILKTAYEWENKLKSI